MKFIYFTGKSLPGTTADHAYVDALARAFADLLGADFLLVGNRVNTKTYEGVRTVAAHVPRFIKRTLGYFFWTPLFVLWYRLWGRNAIFFSNDSNLLSVLLLWRKVGFRYRVISDWHMLSGGKAEGYAARESDLAITTSQRLAKFVSEIGARKVETVHGGVDLSFFELRDREVLRTELHLPPDAFLVAYTGLFKTLGAWKGMDTMVKALPLLPEKVHLLLVGGTHDEIEELKLLAASVGVLERCIVRGRVPFAELARYEMAADALVVPYPDEPHFRNYGFPMKLYEYMAAKKPIIASRLGLIEEVVGESLYGFQAGDEGDLARATREVLEDKTKARERAAYSRSLVESMSWGAKAQRIIELVKNI